MLSGCGPPKEKSERWDKWNWKVDEGKQREKTTTGAEVDKGSLRCHAVQKGGSGGSERYTQDRRYLYER